MFHFQYRLSIQRNMRDATKAYNGNSIAMIPMRDTKTSDCQKRSGCITG
ncbi:hypothetical protein K9U34_03885 [Lawsonia intracellularis]|nr:hypothetical protein [Lawsonia intracellularis]MBZ3892734.1 hypothetical protein [Lawsonia intracellularis]UYH52597.1 hypothetical protein OCT60_04755 [Lawsonia intracellularis]